MRQESKIIDPLIVNAKVSGRLQARADAFLTGQMNLPAHLLTRPQTTSIEIDLGRVLAENSAYEEEFSSIVDEK